MAFGGIVVAGAALSFDGLVTTAIGRRPAASWYFAVSMLVEVAIGQLPTLTGEALALGCVLVLRSMAGCRGGEVIGDGAPPCSCWQDSSWRR